MQELRISEREGILMIILVGIIAFFVGAFTGMVLTSLVTVAGRDKREGE